MAKNTHSQEVLTGTSDSYTREELADSAPPTPIVITRPILGEVDRAQIVEAYTAKGKAIGEPAESVRDELLLEEEEVIPGDDESDEDDSEDEEEEWQPADGGDSTQSSKKEMSESSETNPSPQAVVPTTGSHSSQGQTAVSGASSTDGSTRETEPKQSAKAAPQGRKTPAKKAAPAKQTGARVTHMRGAEDEDDEFL